MPVNPKTPATIDTTKKISAHFSSVIARTSSLRVIQQRFCDVDLTARAGTGSGPPQAHGDSGRDQKVDAVRYPVIKQFCLAQSGSRRQHYVTTAQGRA